MNSWAPIFSKIVDSSLWREDDLVVKVFITLLAKKDKNHEVHGSAFMIGEWAKKTEKEAMHALKILSSPDQKRIEPQPYGGRRIEKVVGGWKILNGQMYENLMRDVNRRNYKTEKQREYRGSRQSAIPPDAGDIEESEDFEPKPEQWRIDRVKQKIADAEALEQRVKDRRAKAEKNGIEE